MDVSNVVIWCCAILFVITALITVLALIGRVKLGGTRQDHSYYLKKLFHILIIETALAGVAAFGTYLVNKPSAELSRVKEENKRLVDENQNLQNQIQKMEAMPQSSTTPDARDFWNKGTAHWTRAQKEITDSESYMKSLEYALKEYRLAEAADPKYPSHSVHVATVLNEMGKYKDAEVEMKKVTDTPEFQKADWKLRGWGLSELAVALYMQGKIGEAQPISEEAYKAGANYRDYIEDIKKKYKENDERRSRIAKGPAQ